MTVSESTADFIGKQLYDLKFRLVSLTPEQLVALRRGYFYRLTQAWIRGIGWVNLCLGGLTFFLSTVFPGNSNLQMFQGLFAIVTIFASIWSITSPMLISLVIWSVLFFIAGIWNVLIANQNAICGGFGLLQLWWAFHLYITFRKDARSASPDAPTLRLYDELQNTMQKIKVRDTQDPDFIQLKLNRRWWQGFLLQDRAVLASRQGIALIIADKGKTTFSFKDGKGILGQRIVGAFDLDGISANRVTFPQTTFERYNRWKELPAAQTDEWLKNLDASTQKRLPFRIAIVLILALPILFLILLAASSILLVMTYGK